MTAKGGRAEICIVGLGHRGFKTFFMSVLGSRAEEVVAVCDTSEKILAEFKEKHPAVPAYPSLDEMIKKHKPHFAIVCVPHKYHLSCISKLSEAGIPVLKEKPIAETMDEFDLLSSTQVKIGVTFQKRFEPRFVQFAKLLHLVGGVASFRATLAKDIQDLDTTWRAGDGVGVTEDLGCHMLDVIVWLFGRPSVVSALRVSSVRRFQDYGGEDISDVSMKWDSQNIIGHAHFSRVAHRDEESIIVTGDNGTLCLDGTGVVLRDPTGAQILETKDTSTKKATIRAMLANFHSFAKDKSVSFPGCLEDLRETMCVMEAVKRAFESGSAELVRTPGSKAASLQEEHFVWPIVTPQIEEATINQMHSSLSIYNRSNVYETFEERWRLMHGLKHALVCSSGTLAILHMFEAIDLRPGDEVLCPVYTFFATASPMLQYGAVPVFCDALSDGNLDPAEISRKSTKKTKAIIVTHMWGLPCDMPSIIAEARKVNGGIKVLEDCSHAHGAVINNRLVGTWGDIAAWSLQAKKNITGGQAGVMATNSTDYYARAVTHGHFNKRAKQEVPEDHPLRKFWLTGIGLNLRAHPLGIAMANEQLNKMSSFMSHRDTYAAMLADGLSLIPFLKTPSLKNKQTDRHSWYAFVMQFDGTRAPHGLTRESFVERLEKRGLKEVDIPRSTGPLNELPLFTDSHEAVPRFGSQKWHANQPNDLFPVAMDFYNRAIKLPVWATARDRPIVEHYIRVFQSEARAALAETPTQKPAGVSRWGRAPLSSKM